MPKKRGSLEPAAPSKFSVAAAEPATPAILSFLAKYAVILSIAAVVLASARIIATYTVFNHTYDEPAHIACGMEWLDKGIYTWETQHPPLARVATAIGPYLLGVRSQNTPHAEKNAMLHEGVAILYSGHHYDLTLVLSRLGILPFFWIACLVVYQWGARYFNRAVAVLSVFIFSFLPPILAHAGLATTDMALTAFLGAAFLTGLMWLEQPTIQRAALFGLCGGLAIASKFSCLPFFPASAGLAFVFYFAVTRPAPGEVLVALRRRVPTLAISAAVAFVAIWACYRFSVGPVSFSPIKLPFPELYSGINEVQTHNARGHYTYLLGERSTHGWWYFFPVVFLVKTPLSYLILLGVGIYLSIRRRLGFDRTWIPLSFAAGIMGVGMSTSINIGIRHILPIYVGLSLIVAATAYWILQRVRELRWQAGALALLGLWFAGSSIMAHPDYLPYFNELAGDHPENIVVDSDLDWGQDMKRLSKRLKEVGAKDFYLSTLLVADFEKEHGFPHRMDEMDLMHPPVGWVAIGFTYWKQTRLGLFDHYMQYQLWPDRIPPLERVGKSMLLWYFPPGAGTPVTDHELEKQ